jgi:hypothetical protein
MRVICRIESMRRRLPGSLAARVRRSSAPEASRIIVLDQFVRQAGGNHRIRGERPRVLEVNQDFEHGKCRVARRVRDAHTDAVPARPVEPRRLDVECRLRVFRLEKAPNAHSPLSGHAVRETADEILHFNSSGIRFREVERRMVAQCSSWSGKPHARGARVAFEEFKCASNDSGRAHESVGLVWLEPPGFSSARKRPLRDRSYVRKDLQ